MFRERLKELRKAANISQEDLASILGVERSSIGKYESIKANVMPSHEVMARIADYFGVSVDYLLGRDDNPGNVRHRVNRVIDSDLMGKYELMPMPKMKQIPLIGEIACGKPILAVEDAESVVPMPEDVKADFALRCKGDSMTGAHIYDGDIVYIREQPMVENGQIAAVIIDDEATLKRVYITKNRVLLQAENSAYQPLVYIGDEMNDIRILGLAVAYLSKVK